MVLAYDSTLVVVYLTGVDRECEFHKQFSNQADQQLPVQSLAIERAARTLMTWPTPSVNSKGCPLSTLESNFLPSASVPCRNHTACPCLGSHVWQQHMGGKVESRSYITV